MVVKREESVDRLVRLMGNGNVKVITGIRRARGELHHSRPTNGGLELLSFPILETRQLAELKRAN